jgi:drug/metabolite transporter (DMT)-like permease
MKSKLIFAVAGLIFCGVTIAWIVAYGRPDNSLHDSALSWSYVLAAGLFAGVGFSAIAYLLTGSKE